jgi:hypothetical protein
VEAKTMMNGMMLPIPVQRRYCRSAAGARQSDRPSLCEEIVTPSGIEAGPHVTGRRRVTPVPTESFAVSRPDATAGCNECNEALDAARDTVVEARRLAIVAENALLNGDLQRARSALRDLRHATTSDAALAASTAHIAG